MAKQTWRDGLRWWWYDWSPYVETYTRKGVKRGWLTPWGYASLCWERLVCALGLQKGRKDPSGALEAFIQRHPEVEPAYVRESVARVLDGQRLFPDGWLKSVNGSRPRLMRSVWRRDG